MQKTHNIEFVPTVDIGFGLHIDGVLYRIAANTPEKRVELEAAQTPEDSTSSGILTGGSMTQAFYLDNRGLIHFWANRYRAKLEGRAVVDIDDLLQAGALGLMEAEGTYQPDKGKWSTWASFYIRKAMLEALGLRGRKSEPFMVSLDAPAYADDDCDVSLLETLADPANPDMDGLLLEDEVVRVVRAAVDDLPEDQRDVTRLHDLQGNSYVRCDELLELNTGESRRINGRALRQLRKDKRLRALALDQETTFIRYKGVTAFHSSGSSTVEDVVLWRLAYMSAKE